MERSTVRSFSFCKMMINYPTFMILIEFGYKPSVLSRASPTIPTSDYKPSFRCIIETSKIKGNTKKETVT